MGYTHSWVQTRKFSDSEWASVCNNIRAIIDFAKSEYSISIVNGVGEEGTEPVFNDKHIMFNGEGDDESCETFVSGKLPRC